MLIMSLNADGNPSPMTQMVMKVNTVFLGSNVEGIYQLIF